MGKKRNAAEPRTRRTSFAQPAGRRALSTRERGDWKWVPWLLVSLTIFAVVPHMTAGNYLPKTFWAALTVALGLLFVPPRSTDRIEITLVGLVWMAYMAWALVSLFWAPSSRTGFERWLALLLPTLAYLLAKRTRFWESSAFWTAFCVLIWINALIGLLQYASERYVPGFIKYLVDNFPGTAVPRGTMGERNYAGMYYALTIPFLVWFYYRAPLPRWVLPLISLGLGVLFLLLTKTRAAWLGTLFGAVFFLLAGTHGSLKEHGTKTKILVACAVVAVLVAILLRPAARVEKSLGYKAGFSSVLKSFTNPMGRLHMWSEALSVPINRLAGAGFGNFPVVATPHSPEKSVKTLNWEVHNDYLQALVDLGIPGLALFTLTFVLLLRQAWLGRRSGIVLTAGAAMVSLCVMQFFMFTSELVCSLTWIAGIAAILNSGPGAVPTFSRRVPMRLPLLLNLLAVAWLFCFTVGVGYSISGDRAFFRLLGQIAGLAKRGTKATDAEKAYIRDGIKRLAFETLPQLKFDANMRHLHCHELARWAMDAKDYASASRLVETALKVHPTDRNSLYFRAEIALASARAADAKKQPDEVARYLAEAEQQLRRGAETFGYDPYAKFAPALAQVLTFEKKDAESAAIREKMEPNRVGMPSGPLPADRATGVASPVPLAWDACKAAESYSIYLWKVGEAIPQTEAALRVNEPRLPKGLPLEPGTTYLWQIEARGRYAKERGPIWCFRTAP
jgi:O-antigen ligase